MTSVVIVDDHAVVRQGIRAYLATQPDIEVVAEAASGEEAVKVVADTVPDVVLMDLIMPGMDGVEATRQITRISPRTQVIVLTSFHDDIHIFPALKAGAQSYLLKDIGPAQLVEAIRVAARGEAVLHPQVAARLAQELRGGRADNTLTELTPREHEILRLIAEGLSNAEIADRLVISEKTVKGHVSNILSKLHVADRTQAAIYAWREGVVRKE